MLTKYFRSLLAQNIFNTSGMSTIPAKYVLGLSTTKPTEDGDNITEIQGKGYARVAIKNNSNTFSSKDDITSVNSNIIYFPESTDRWNNIKYILLLDDENHLLMWQELEHIIEVPRGTILYIDKEQLISDVKGE